MEHAVRILNKWHNFIRGFVTLASIKSPVGSPWEGYGNYTANRGGGQG